MEIKLIIVCYVLPGDITNTANISNHGDTSVTCEGEERNHVEAIAVGYKVHTNYNASQLYLHYKHRRPHWLAEDYILMV